MMSQSPDFSSRLLSWFDAHGRKDLPWQIDINAYRVWLSEIMLQQTQVTTVIPYFLRFVEQYPTVEKLADAPLGDVLHLWTGLGYYARARNLHKTAHQVLTQHGGRFPHSVDELCTLPGIGRSTAGAIVSIAYGKRAAILDGNVKRVLARHQAIAGWPGSTVVHNQLWAIAETFTPQEQFGKYTQAIMDLGATLCTRNNPDCDRCPVGEDCRAKASKQQSQYPGKKPRQQLPVREKQWLILINGEGEVLLKKRPPTGLWGGLWTFLEPEDCEEMLNTGKLPEGKLGNGLALTTRRHTFSHFHLDYQPVIHRVNPKNSVAESPSLEWVDPERLDGKGTPAPVKKMLEEIIAQQDDLFALG